MQYAGAVEHACPPLLPPSLLRFLSTVSAHGEKRRLPLSASPTLLRCSLQPPHTHHTPTLSQATHVRHGGPLCVLLRHPLFAFRFVFYILLFVAFSPFGFDAAVVVMVGGGRVERCVGVGRGADVCVPLVLCCFTFLLFFNAASLYLRARIFSYSCCLRAVVRCFFCFSFSAYPSPADDADLRTVMKGDGTTATPLSIDLYLYISLVSSVLTFSLALMRCYCSLVWGRWRG